MADGAPNDRPAPPVGAQVRVYGKNGRVRGRARVTGFVHARRAEYAPARRGAPAAAVDVDVTYVQVEGVGWCPLHRDRIGAYVRAGEATAELPAPSLFDTLAGP